MCDAGDRIRTVKIFLLSTSPVPVPDKTLLILRSMSAFFTLASFPRVYGILVDFPPSYFRFATLPPRLCGAVSAYFLSFFL